MSAESNTAPRGAHTVAEHRRRVLHSSETNDWHTPGRIVAAVREVLGGIDLDPASCAEANATVGATRFYTAEDDGLRKPWSGRVFLNPPYGFRRGRQSNAEVWSKRLAHEYDSGNVSAAILLVNASPDTQWFQRLWCRTICFHRGRIAFVRPRASKASRDPTHANAVVCFGNEFTEATFANVFEAFGRIVWPEDVG